MLHDHYHLYALIAGIVHAWSLTNPVTITVLNYYRPQRENSLRKPDTYITIRLHRADLCVGFIVVVRVGFQFNRDYECESFLNSHVTKWIANMSNMSPDEMEVFRCGEKAYEAYQVLLVQHSKLYFKFMTETYNRIEFFLLSTTDSSVAYALREPMTSDEKGIKPCDCFVDSFGATALRFDGEPHQTMKDYMMKQHLRAPTTRAYTTYRIIYMACNNECARIEAVYDTVCNENLDYKGRNFDSFEEALALTRGSVVKSTGWPEDKSQNIVKEILTCYFTVSHYKM